MSDLNAAATHFEVFCNGVGDENRPMPTTRTANGDGHVGFAFLVVLWNQVVEKSAQMAEKNSCFILGIHVVDDRRIATRKAFQVRHKIRIRQEPDIENQILIDGYAIFESKAHQRYEQMAGTQLLKQRQGMLTQIMDREL